MAFDPFQPVGQQVMASSKGVVIASDQSPVSVTGTVTIANSIPTSVSGTVGSSIIGWVPVQLSNTSIIAVAQGSVAVAIVSGSIAASFTPPANQSVSGTVDVAQITNPWIITGSVQGSFSPSANQSVSGVVGSSIIGYPAVNVGGSVAAWLQSSNASVITVGTPAANQSVSGTVGSSVIGWVPIQTSNTSVISYVQNSVATVIIGGSIAASFTPPANQSVSGTVDIGVMPGSVAAFIKGNASIITIAQGSVAVAIVSGSITASFTPPANQSVSGTVDVTQITSPWIITGSVQGTFFPSNQSVSGVTGSSIIGYPAVNVGGSVAAWLQSSNASVITVGTAAPNQSVSGTVGASIIGYPAVNVGGSVAAFQGGTWNVSVVGNMATTSSVYLVASSITTVSIMAANANRKMGTILNTAATPVFVKLGTAATTSVYTVLMNPNDYYELPGGWTGVVAGIANSTAGVMNVTELT